MQSLFKPGAKINQDHKHKYIHILAYAASVVETWKKVLSVLRMCGPQTDQGPPGLWCWVGSWAAGTLKAGCPALAVSSPLCTKYRKSLGPAGIVWHLSHWD